MATRHLTSGTSTADVAVFCIKLLVALYDIKLLVALHELLESLVGVVDPELVQATRSLAALIQFQGHP